MPPTYQNDLVLATMHCLHSATSRESLVTFAFNDGARNASAQEWAVALHDAWGFDMQARLTTEAAWTRVTTLKGDGSTVPEAGEDGDPVYQGDFAMSAAPPNVAALVQKKTGFGGRGNRGRVYLPWSVNEGEVDEIGQLTAVARTALQTAVDLFYGTLGVGSNMVIANRIYDLPWDNPNRQLTALMIGKPVTSLRVDGLVATQRRRLR
jgi:hypothetical protein